MSELRTDYKNDELATSMGGKRRYRMIENSDGTVSFEDVTSYSVVGDEYDADDINSQNEAINQLNNDLSELERSGLMKFVDTSTAVAITATPVTATKDGLVSGNFYDTAKRTLYIDSMSIGLADNGVQSGFVYYPVKAGQIVKFDTTPIRNEVHLAYFFD